MRSLLLFTASTLAFASAALAEPVPSAEPGRVQQRLERPERPELFEKSLVDEITLPSGADLSPDVRFELKSISISGATALPADKIEPLYKDKIGQTVSLADIQAIVRSITDLYRSEGFLLSKAVLPAQRIGDGAVTIQIIEGSIDKIEFRGEPVDNGVLKAYADKIRASVPLRVEDLERYLLLMDDLAGLTARGTLSASQAVQGASDLIITLERRKYDGRVSFDNRGSKFLGPLQADASIAGNDLFGLNELVELRTLQSSDLDELNYYQASYRQPIGGDGLSLYALVSHTSTDPGDSLSAFDIEGESLSVIGSVSYPYLRSRRENVFVSGGFVVRDSESETLGTQTYDDAVRALTLSGDYDLLDSFSGVNRLNLTLTQGIDVLGANDDNDLVSRSNAESDFTKLSFYASRLQTFNSSFGAQLSSHGQIASDELYSSEEFSVGGDSFLTAFDPAEITGDHGIAGRLELHYNGNTSADWLDSYQVYTFIDGAVAYNINPLAGEDDRASASTAGLGVRFDVLEQFRSEIEFAHPLSHDSVRAASEDNAGIYFRISYLLP